MARMKRIKNVDRERYLILLALFVIGLPFIGGLVNHAEAQTKHEKITVNLLLAPSGSVAYTLGYGVADIINRHHPWLKASAIETFGFVDNIKAYAAKSTEDKKRTIFFSNSIITDQASLGVTPFQKKYSGLKPLFSMYQSALIMATTDPNIKRPQDLMGHRVSIGPIGITSVSTLFMLREVFGVLDKVKATSMNFSATKDAMLDGRVECAAMPFIKVREGKYLLAPWGREVQASRPLYFLSITKEAFVKAAKASPFSWVYTEVPKDGLGKNLPPKTIGGLYLPNGMFTGPETDPEIIYEFVKTISENIDELGTYHALGKAQNVKTLATGTWNEKSIHPEALKYFKEKEITVGPPK